MKLFLELVELLSPNDEIMLWGEKWHVVRARPWGDETRTQVSLTSGHKEMVLVVSNGVWVDKLLKPTPIPQEQR